MQLQDPATPPDVPDQNPLQPSEPQLDQLPRSSEPPRVSETSDTIVPEQAPQQPIEEPATAHTPQPQGDNPGMTLGIIGLVLTVVGMGLVGLVLAIIALKKSKKAGFGNVPALISIILNAIIFVLVIPITILLVLTTFSGVQERARDSERQADINTIHAQLEEYYTEYGGYPTLADLNNSTWRSANDISLTSESFVDPSATDKTAMLVSKTPVKAREPYSYNSLTPTACVSPTDDTGNIVQTSNSCTGYQLTAHQEVSRTSYYKTNYLDPSYGTKRSFGTDSPMLQ